MKIAFIAPEYLPIPPMKGGAVEEWIEQVARRLSKYEVYIFSIYDKTLPRHEKEGNIVYSRFKPGIISKILLSTYKLPFKNDASRLFQLPYSLWCSLKLRNINPDIIHIHNRPHFIWIVKFLNPKARIVLHTHQLSALESMGSFRRDILNKVDLLLGCSKFLSSEIKKRFPHCAAPQYIYNGYAQEKFVPYWENHQKREVLRRKFKIGAHEKVVLYAGRLVENKGVHLLIKAFQLLNKKYENIKLLIAGGTVKGFSESYGEHLQWLSKNSKAIIFLGKIPTEEIAQYYLLADIVVIPSIVKEGFCNIAIEAMACGLPVITSGRGGLSELIEDNENGLVVSHIEEVPLLSGAIEKLLRDDNLRMRLGKNGYEFVKGKFTWENTAHNISNIYNSLIERKNILYYDPSSGFGGSSSALVKLVNNLNREEFNPVVVIRREGPNFDKIVNAKIIKLRHSAEKEKMSLLELSAYFIVRIMPEVIRLRSIILKERIHLVHINISILWGIPAIIAARLAGIPCICHIRATLKGLIKREKLFLKWVAKVIVINKDAYAIYSREIPKEKLLLFYDGADANDFKYPLAGSLRREFNLDGAQLVGLVGRIVAGKGHKEFILAAKEILKHKPLAKFMIVGDAKGEDRAYRYFQEVKDLVRRENLGNSVLFTGWRTDITNIIADLDVLVQASTTFPEGLPNTIIEAMALKKPVVATQISGPSDIVVNGETGFLVPPADIKAMSEKILHLLNNPLRAEKMGASGKGMVEQFFNIQTILREIEKVYKELANLHNAAG